MQKLLISLINTYQFFSSVGICKYEISCSQYTKQAIRQVGVIRGSLMGLKRIWSCR